MDINPLDRTLDFIMMTFGELTDACTIISRCALRLEPDDRLLTEVHTFEEVKRQGMTEANGHTTRFGSQMTAWRDDEYVACSIMSDLPCFLLLKATTGQSARHLKGSYLLCWLKKPKNLEELPLNTQHNKRNSALDIPRIFTISESEHRIHNPFTEEKYATLGRVLRMKPDARILDLGSGSGEMLCTWARDHAITGVGIDMSQLFSEQAKRRAEELGVSSRVQFIHNDAAGHVAEEKFDVVACIGATWIAGGFAGTVGLLAQSLKPGGFMLIGEPYWRQLPAAEEIAQACGVNAIADFLTLPELIRAFDGLGYDVVEMVLADQEGWDRYEAAKWLTMRRWLEANPDDDFAAEVRAELTVSPKRHVTYTREYIGWGVFALIAR